MVDVYKISAITLIITNMKRSCDFYSQIPGFKLIYGGSSEDSFTTYKIGNNTNTSAYLNLELNLDTNICNSIHYLDRKHFGRIVFHTDDVDKLYSYFKSNRVISNIISFEKSLKMHHGKIFSYKRTRRIPIIICSAYKTRKKILMRIN